jgi:transposase-like protein/DDE family transposase
MKTVDLPAAATEFAGADFGDPRLTRRLMRIADAAAAAPSAGFPEMTGSDGELEGVYRFLRNGRVTPQKVLAPHIAATQQRAAGATVIVAHDTTDLGFGGTKRRQGLGRVGSSNCVQGFQAHFALVVSADESRTPLGVAGLKPMVRPWEHRSRIPKRERDMNPDQSEARRWTELAFEVATRFPAAIHVMDREADCFTLFARLMAAGLRFVVRLGRDKKIADSSEKLFATAANAEVMAVRSVPLSFRARHSSAGNRHQHAAREERIAKLQLRAGSFTVPRPHRPRYATGYPESLTVNVVTVVEIDTPAGDEPVCWRLITTEPIETPAQVEAIVDAYRARWRVEEFFKALKTGCAFEKRQLESLRTLVNALAVFSMIAWRLLVLRSVARIAPDGPATEVLTPEQVRVLQALSVMRAPGIPKIDMPRNATAHDALLAVAALGGHIKNNGAPGWLVLGRGYDSLLLLQMAGRLARHVIDDPAAAKLIHSPL